MEGEQECKTLLDEDYPVYGPMISPNGRWMTYTSNESGDFKVYVSPFPNVDGGRWQISSNGGSWPIWSPDPNRRELFYLHREDVISVEFEETESTFTPRSSRKLFSGSYTTTSFKFWDIRPDGKRFLMITDTLPQENAEYKIIVVQNWFEELKKLAPMD